MPYFRPAQERPRQTKRFLTVREIEDLAAEGTLEIVHEEGLVITDAAREAAHDLGLRIVKPAQQAAKPPQPPAAAAPVPATAPAAATLAAAPASPAAQMPALPRMALPPAPPSAGTLRIAAAGGDAAPRIARVPAQGDPFVRALVDAVRTNLPVLAALARKG